MIIKLLLAGLASYIPGMCRFKATGGTISARYCYSVWLRHLLVAHRNGLSTEPDTIAELGPGDSIGIGLAALLTGATRYYALDVVEFARTEQNIMIFDELVELFKKREDIPDEREFPKLKPYLESYAFPSEILTEERLAAALKPEKLKAVREAIPSAGGNSSGEGTISIQYIVPWHDPALIQPLTVDMIYSQAVLEHVDDLPFTYGSLSEWLKPGGFMSHQIDFKCHGTAARWNGHWAYPDFIWKIIKGNRPYLINREPLSTHLKHARDRGFAVLDIITVKSGSGIAREQLAGRFKSISEDDLVTSGAFILWAKPPAGPH